MIKICSSCFETCGERAESSAFDYAGTHCTNGRSGTHDPGVDIVSDCCGEPILEVPTELFEYHQSIKKALGEVGLDSFLYDNPFFYQIEFNSNIEVEEVVANFLAIWGKP